MTSGELTGLLIAGGIFIAIAMVTVLLGLLQYRITGSITAEVKVACAVLLIGVGALLSVALTTRTLNETGVEGGRTVLYDDYVSGFAASRWLSLFLLAAAVVEIARGWLKAHRSTQADPAAPLLVALLTYYLGTMLVQGFWSEHIGFSHKELYVPVLLLAVYYLRVTDLAPVMSAAKWVIMALTFGSLAGIVIRPDFVLHRPDPGLFPGIDWRLFGLTAHANTLGSVALLGILLELYWPSRHASVRLLNLLGATAVLILAQSRTAWAAAPLIFVVARVPMLLAPGDARAFRRAVWTLVACFAAVIVVACAMTVFGGIEYLQRKTDLGTLNGRFQIWDITLEAWRENMLFGYGPEIWGAERRARLNMFHVGQAHNQAIQTLGEAGLVGLALLMAYLLTLLYAACRRFIESRGLTLALLVLVLTRCVTEAPMRSEGLLSWATFLQVLLVVAACHYLRRPVPAWSEPVSTGQARTSGAANEGPVSGLRMSGHVGRRSAT